MYRIMHISDIHWESRDTLGNNTDNKIGIPNIGSTKNDEFLNCLSTFLSNNEKINLFIISGDIIKGGDIDAQTKFCNSFIQTIQKHGYKEENILIVPGNHDVLRNAEPGSPERYKYFYDTWKDCNIPYLDGCNNEIGIVADERRKIMIIPLNTANVSQVSTMPDNIKNLIPNLHPDIQAKIKKCFQHDPAYISKEQFDALEEKIKSFENYEEYKKILVQHHHFTQVSKNIEVKSLPDILNIEELKEFIKKFNIRVLLHGHKHRNKDFYNYLEDSENSDYPYQFLVSSSANINSNHIFKILEIKNCSVTIQRYNFSTCKRENKKTFSICPKIESSYSIIFEDDDVTKLYGKINACFKEKKNFDTEYDNINIACNKQIICHLNLVKKYYTKEKVPIRNLYKEPDKQTYFEEFVKRYSKLWLKKESFFKDEIPIHGIRLKQYGGHFNQVKYIIDIINSKKSKSRGVAVLLEPIKDFKISDNSEKNKTDYPSFMTCQITVRPKNGHKYLDIIANYRSQEMHHWWQLNIVELFYLLCEIKSELNEEYKLGNITTITALPSFAKEAAYGRAYVSLVDYLLDTSNEILPYLAHSLMCDNKGKINEDSDFIRECDRIFEDINLFTAIKINSDGNSRLRDGIKIFTLHLEKAANKKNPLHSNFINSMKKLTESINKFNLDDDNGYNVNKFNKNMDAIKKSLENVINCYEELKRELCN